MRTFAFMGPHHVNPTKEHSQRMLVCSMRTFAFMGSHHENPSTEHSQLMLVCSLRMFFRRRMFVLERLRRTCACAKNGPVQLPRCEGTDGLTSTLHRERSHHEPLTCESCRSPSHVVPSNAFYGWQITREHLRKGTVDTHSHPCECHFFWTFVKCAYTIL